MEDALTKLRAPVWPQAVLGPIDRAKARRGKGLFATYCAACHGVARIAGTNPTQWNMTVVPIDRIGTDPNQAVDYAKHTFDATKLGLGNAVRTAEGLAYVVSRVQRQAYVDAHIPPSQWPTYDGFGRKSNFSPAPCGYKARPLIGVWATGPFLHNGSVPTIYDLLSETRPSSFRFGSEEFDPKKLGFVSSDGPNTMLFDSHQPGNSNAGHWFTRDDKRPGRIGPALSEEQKYDLIEYLKEASFSDYPSKTVSRPRPLPCENDPKWADGRPVASLGQPHGPSSGPTGSGAR
jgi:hypothetical protein